MKYLRQIFFELRHQPLVTWLSIAGTAIAIGLIMTDYMLDSIDYAPMRPESNRERIVYGSGIDVAKESGGDGSSYLNYETAQKLYANLPEAECVSFSLHDTKTCNVAVTGSFPESYSVKSVDENFWKIYDFTFEQGEPFTKEESDAGQPLAILTHSVAESCFGKGNAIGKRIEIDGLEHTVKGVIEDPSRILDLSYSDIYSTISKKARLFSDGFTPEMGYFEAIILLRSAADKDKIKSAVESRYATLNAELKKEGRTLSYHNQPYDTYEMHLPHGTNTTPDTEGPRRKKLIFYTVLILIPAINLSSMTRSRLKNRISQIGVMRAFGCSRGRLFADLLGENLIITLIGGLIGIILSVAFILCFSNYFVIFGNVWNVDEQLQIVRPDFGMIFSWTNLLVLLGFCFILNLLSAGLPVLKAALTNPAEAVSGHSPNK